MPETRGSQHEAMRLRSWVSLAKGCCWLARRCLNLKWAGCADPSVSTQGLCDNLIHVVVTIGRESADKLDIMCSVRQLLAVRNLSAANCR